MEGNKKEIWIKADAGTWAERKARITAGLESGVDGVLVETEDVAKVRELGRTTVAAFAAEAELEEVEGEEEGEADIVVFGKRSEGDGTLPIPTELSESSVLSALKRTFGSTTPKLNAGYVELRGKDYERFAVNIADYSNYVIVIGKDWKIIPLENIIAELQRKDAAKVIAGVQSAEEARTALEILEYGADGVLIDTDDISEIKKAVEMRDASVIGNIPLATARITGV